MVFYISVILLLLFLIWGFLMPESLSSIADKALTFTTDKFGWMLLLITLGILVFIVYLGFSKYGKLKLGSENDEPQFNNLTWFGMLFSAGMGIGLIFWGVAEPLDHYVYPPNGVDALTAEAANVAMTYSFFHWGLHAWAIYSLVGLTIGYFRFRKNKNLLISSTISPLINASESSFIFKIIDILAIIATAFGVVTSLGLGALQINGGLNNIFGIPVTEFVQVIIILISTVLFLLSASTGLEKGIKILSNINIGIAILLMLFVFLTGPTFNILEILTNTLGKYFQNIISLSLKLTPFSSSAWIANWTLFYWAWWISWSPFVGVFIARISKGRTIREFVWGVLLVPTVFSFMWFATFGGTALNLQRNTSLDLTEIVSNDITSTLFVTLKSLPFGTFISLIAILLIVTFFVSSADSATFVLGMFSSSGSMKPSVRVKFVWGLLLSLTAIVLLTSGGLKGLQTMAIVTALPFSIVLVFMIISLMKSLMNERIVTVHKVKLPKGIEFKKIK